MSILSFLQVLGNEKGMHNFQQTACVLAAKDLSWTWSSLELDRIFLSFPGTQYAKPKYPKKKAKRLPYPFQGHTTK